VPRLTSAGVCALCGEKASAAKMAAHLRRCAPSHDAPKGAAVPLHQLHVQATYSPVFWLDIEAKSGATLRQLDQFLRRIWLECCGHLSAFRIGSQTYSVALESMFTIFEGQRSMSARLADALPPQGRPFRYEYDFGSTTDLTLRVTGSRPGVIGRPAVRLLARNEAPVWPCATCGAPATGICANCLDENNPFACSKHERQHACGEDSAFLPVVNSPRMGVCAYGAV
jgi:hypothetical protein